MKRLTIKNFSCLQQADIQLGRITLLIGPQASGKSVIAKLIYFFLSTLQYRSTFEQEAFTYDSYKAAAKELFLEWFPSSAWGSKPFTISFEAGDLKIKISRVTYRKSITDNIRVWASDAVRGYYESVGLAKDTLLANADRDDTQLELQLSWELRKTARKLLTEAMGSDYIDAQVFIPAGRSFFTSLGRTLTAFEHGGLLDPFVLNFGKLYAHVLDYPLSRRFPNNQTSELVQGNLAEIFGGKIERDGKTWVVRTDDGRRIPMSSLSSGQQELLPLLTVLPYLLNVGKRPEKTALKTRNSLIYIEEPEAHLFPQAQTKLVEVLSGMAGEKGRTNMLFITTHSPYVLSKFNNLAFAGTLATTLPSSKKALVNKLVSVGKQIPPGALKAYAIVEGNVTGIVSEDGLVSADYLDKISEDISKEFSQLLGIGYGDQE